MKFPAPVLLRAVLVLAVVAGWLLVGLPAARADELTRRVQEELRKRNLYFGDVDGRASAQLATALHRYQERKGFASTGQADPDTLYSLNVMRPGEVPPSLPDARAAATRAENTPPEITPAPLPPDVGGLHNFAWPDVTVLRSDAARPAPTDAEIAAEPVPTFAPPPAATGMIHRPSVEQVRDFVARYLAAGEKNDSAQEMGFYGDHVSYYDDGRVDHAYIVRDVGRYDRRWPERHFTLFDPVELSPSSDGDPDKFVVNFRFGFHVKNAHYTVSGKADSVWTISGHEPRDWKIVSMKEQRVRGK